MTEPHSAAFCRALTLGEDSLLNLELQFLPGQQGIISGEADSETIIILPITTVLQASCVDAPV